MEDIYVIGEHKDIAIYLTHENGKNIYAWVKYPFWEGGVNNESEQF